MWEESQSPDLLTADPPPSGPGLDPVEAVMAVAEPRNAELHSGPLETGPGGVLVETKVAFDGNTPADLPKSGPDGGTGGTGYEDIEWPEGYVADPKAMAKFVPIAQKFGLSRDAAQELARLYADLDQERSRSQADFIARNNAEWLREIESHPEFGGRRLQETGEGVAAMLRRYGSPLLMAQIRQMNVQNWPEMFYFLARVSRAVSEDCSPSGNGDNAAVKSTAQILFPGLK